MRENKKTINTRSAGDNFMIYFYILIAVKACFYSYEKYTP